MSYVYTAVIQIGAYNDDSDAALEKFNTWLAENGHMGGLFEYIDGQKSAGTKAPEINLIWGGFNYLNVEEFVSLFKSLKLERSLLTIFYPESERCLVVPSLVELEGVKCEQDKEK